jgi:hypothetical protein
LRWFGAAFHEGVKRAPAQPRMLFRADISRPQWQRNALDGVLDYNVVGSALRPYHRLVMDRARANGEITLENGSSNAIEDSNIQPLAWCIDAWSLGCAGVVPWNTLGSLASWGQADEVALFYPGRGNDPPIPSVRLKAYRRGQQYVEYLTLLARLLKQPRWAVGRAVQAALPLTWEQKGTQTGGAEDAGVVHYPGLRPQDVWSLRVKIGTALSKAAPRPERRLLDWRTPRRDAPTLPPGYVSGSHPNSSANNR